MSKRRPILVAFIVTSLSQSLFLSCVDNDYDLNKDIDMTVTVGGNNLALPSCSTDTISLKKIFDLSDDESNTLKTNKGEITSLSIGDYYLNENNGDNPTISTLTIEKTTLNLGSSTETGKELEFENIPNIPDELTGIIEQVNIQELVDLTTEFNLHNEEVPGQLRRLDWVEVSAPVKIRIYFTSEDGVGQLNLQKGIKIEFGEFLEFQPYTTDFYKVEGNKVVITNDVLINSNGKIIELTLQRIDLEGYGLTGNFTPADDPRNEDLHGIIDLPMDVKVNGYVSLALKDFPDNKQTVKAEFRAEIQIEEAEIQKAKGIIDPNFAINFDPIDFVDIPEFLNDEDTDIDLFNPQITLNINNTAPVGINIEAELVGLDEHGNIITVDGKEARVKIGRPSYEQEDAIYLHDNKNNKFTFSILDPTNKQPDVEYVQLPNLNDLIRKIPAKIGIQNIRPTVPQIPYTVTLNRTHEITTQYEIITPLAFGENLNFVYKDTLDGWGEDLGDIHIKEVEVELVTENTIPMEMDLEATPIGTDSKEIHNVQVTVNGKIAAGNGNPNEAKEGTIKINLLCPDRHLDGLDGISLKITGSSDSNIAGIPLNEKQTLKIKSAKVRIKEGITVDLN